MRRGRSKRSSRRSSPKTTPVRYSRRLVTKTDCRFPIADCQFQIGNWKSAFSPGLGCHPASDFFGFTFRVSSGHQSLQTTERARHVPLSSRETQLIVQRCSLGCIVKEIEPSVIYNLRSDLVSPK